MKNTNGRRKFLATGGTLMLGTVLAGCGGDMGMKSSASKQISKNFSGGLSPTTSSSFHLVGYSDKESYAPGENMRIYLNAEGAPNQTTFNYSITNYFTGLVVANGTISAQSRTKVSAAVDTLSGGDQRWPESGSISIGSNWTPSVYFITFGTNSDGEKLYFVVQGNSSEMLVVLPTATMQAYNNYGGAGLYDFDSENSEKARRVSLNRPNTPESNPVGYGFGFAFEQSGANDLIKWIITNGWSPNFATDWDLHSNPNLLSQVKTLIFCGHNEYWSREMRDNVNAYLIKGGNIANFAGNSCWWRIRYEGSNNRTIVCYKDRSDPVTDNRQVTINWHDTGESAKQILGCGFESGAYNYASRPPLALTAYNVNHWAFNGTGLQQGAMFGGNEGIAGYEVDGVSVVWNGGVPSVAPNSNTPNNFVILGYAPTTGWDNPNGNMTIGVYQHSAGGEVFNGAAVNWGLAFRNNSSSNARNENTITRMTYNVLSRFTKLVRIEEYTAPISGGSKFIYVSDQQSAPPEGWTKTGIFFRARSSSVTNTIPVYRHFANTNGQYKEILSSSSDLSSIGWQVAGVAFFAYANQDNGRTPIYRIANSNTTMGWSERYSANNILNAGETLVGVAFYI